MAYNPNIQISETEDYNNQVSQIKQITLDMVKKIAEMCCQELTEGYWEKKPIKLGGSIMISEVYKPDTRIGYCNAMDFLIMWVYPESGDEFKKLADKLWSEEKDLKSPSRNEEDKFHQYVEDKVVRRREIFRLMCIMFHKKRFFDDTSGWVDRPAEK